MLKHFQQPPTSSNWNANQIVDKSKDKVDPDPFHCLFGEVDAGDDIQEVVLQMRQRRSDEDRTNSVTQEKQNIFSM